MRKFTKIKVKLRSIQFHIIDNVHLSRVLTSFYRFFFHENLISIENICNRKTLCSLTPSLMSTTLSFSLCM